MPQTPVLLRLEHVTKRYDAPDGRAGPAVLEDVCLELAAGQSLAVVGPSGCGKSTLLNLIGALDRPTAGQVLLAGRDLAGLDDPALAAIRNHSIGFVFQLHHLLPQCTALENVLLPTLAKVSPKRGAAGRAGSAATATGSDGLTASKLAMPPDPHDRAVQLLQRVGLGNRLDYWPGQLSGGERQRVAVARALINQPRLLLADEPTGALDQAASREMTELLAELQRDCGVAMVVVTHWLELARRMQRVMRLQNGRLLEVDSSGPAGGVLP
jgi:ABC-type lipoprotein export system ATPase subunit